jgi:hypothetical protein
MGTIKVENVSIQKVLPTQNKTETLSSLLKRFELVLPKTNELIEESAQIITLTKLKNQWSQKKIIHEGNHLDAEMVALNTTKYLEKCTEEISEKIELINGQKKEALEFARNCFVYLNKVHKNTCLGEAGEIMLKLFDSGELSGNTIFGLLEHAEVLSEKKKLPFANKLSKEQSGAIDFMVEERNTRISPTIENLQNFFELQTSINRWLPLLKALEKDEYDLAQKLINELPS